MPLLSEATILYWYAHARWYVVERLRYRGARADDLIQEMAVEFLEGNGAVLNVTYAYLHALDRLNPRVVPRVCETEPPSRVRQESLECSLADWDDDYRIDFEAPVFVEQVLHALPAWAQPWLRRYVCEGWQWGATPEADGVTPGAETQRLARVQQRMRAWAATEESV